MGHRHGPDSRARRPKYQPARLEDMAAHLAGLQAFIVERGRAEATRLNDDVNWRNWKEHCQEVETAYGLQIDPEDAPFLAFTELPLRRRADGRPVAAGTV